MGNVGFTEEVCNYLLGADHPVPLLFSSSVQAEQDTPYGRSKREAEEVVRRYASQKNTRAIIYRLTNVFGKWARPDYNSVVATFCHRAARDLPLTISDPHHEIEFVYIDDVVAHFGQELTKDDANGVFYRDVRPSFRATLGRLAELVGSFRSMRHTSRLQEFGDPFTRKLYATYLSYVETDDFAYPLDRKCDSRGCLAEFVKSASAGQVFVSTTQPGTTRGDHYHHTKTEKFMVLEGEAIIRLRDVRGGEVIEYAAHGDDFLVVDIPPGYAHSIENVGDSQLVTLFWASEVFDPHNPDTTSLRVLATP